MARKNNVIPIRRKSLQEMVGVGSTGWFPDIIKEPPPEDPGKAGKFTQGTQKVPNVGGCDSAFDCKSLNCAPKDAAWQAKTGWKGQCMDPAGYSGCTSDSQCQAGEHCQDGYCTPAVVQPGGCLTDADCASGEVCENGQCTAYELYGCSDPEIIKWVQGQIGAPVTGSWNCQSQAKLEAAGYKSVGAYMGAGEPGGGCSLPGPAKPSCGGAPITPSCKALNEACDKIAGCCGELLCQGGKCVAPPKDPGPVKQIAPSSSGWFWGLLGLLAAGGVGTAVYLGTREDDKLPKSKKNPCGCAKRNCARNPTRMRHPKGLPRNYGDAVYSYGTGPGSVAVTWNDSATFNVWIKRANSWVNVDAFTNYNVTTKAKAKTVAKNWIHGQQY